MASKYKKFLNINDARLAMATWNLREEVNQIDLRQNAI